MNKLEERYLDIISKYTNDESIKFAFNNIEAAGCCVSLTLELMKGFAEWMDDNGFTQLKNGKWGSLNKECPIEQLIEEYIKTL